MTASLPRFVERFGDLLPDEGLGLLHAFVPRLGEWRNDLLDRPLTIAHADYRLENMLFHPDGEVAVIDWQTAMYTGGPTDLSFFLATNLNRDHRAANRLTNCSASDASAVSTRRARSARAVWRMTRSRSRMKVAVVAKNGRGPRRWRDPRARQT